MVRSDVAKKKTRPDKEKAKTTTTTRGATPRTSVRDATPRSKRSIPAARPRASETPAPTAKASWSPGLTIPVEDDWLDGESDAEGEAVVVKPPPLPKIEVKRAAPPPLPATRAAPPPLPTKRSVRRPPRTS